MVKKRMIGERKRRKCPASVRRPLEWRGRDGMTEREQCLSPRSCGVHVNCYCYHHHCFYWVVFGSFSLYVFDIKEEILDTVGTHGQDRRRTSNWGRGPEI